MAEIVNIKHESDLSEYTTTQTGGGDLSQGTPGLAGTVGRMEALINDTGAIHGEKTFTQLTSDSFRWRLYLDPNSLSMNSGNEFIICTLDEGGSGRAAILLSYDGADYQIRARLKDDGGSYRYTSKYTVSDAEHYIETLCTKAANASSNDAILRLWIDGSQQESRENIDWYNQSLPDSIQLGATSGLDAGTSGTFYLDELILRDDTTEIGAVPVVAGYGWIF